MKHYLKSIGFIFLSAGLMIIMQSCPGHKTSVPTVTTTNVTGLTTTSAVSGGNVTNNGGEDVTARGVCWSTTQNPTTALISKTTDGKSNGTFTSSITGLSANTNYYVRAYATNSEGTDYGNEISFTTSSVTIATLTTTVISSITSTTAVSGGNITDDGGGTITARGVCWNTSSNPTTANNITTDGTGIGSFTSNLANLQPGTTYYLKAYATNSGGTGYAKNELTFTTQCTAPSATTNAATSLANTTATLNGAVNANGCSIVVTFDYGLTATYGSTLTAVQSPVSGTTLTSVSVGITGLTSGQTYHYRVKVVSTVGTAYGGDILFTTAVNDKDGNVYDTVTIGTQVWIKENLKTTKYNDGTSIPNVTDNATWGGLSTGAYSWYNNDAATYKNIYGALYNWYTVNTGKLCPAGWHVPTDAEWTTLTDYLGGASVAGGKLKEAGTTHWSSPNTGATNESGFTALPGGWRNFNGTFYEITNFGIFLSSTEFSATNASCKYMGFNYVFVDRNNPSKSEGHSIRCIRD